MTMTGTPVHQSNPRWRLAVAAVTLVAAAGGAVALSAGFRDQRNSTATTSTTVGGAAISPGGSSASCVEPYSLENLAHRETAFAGTVTAVSGDQVTFAVERWFRGGTGTVVTLRSSTGGAISSDGSVPLEPASRLLVSADGGFVWSCGFTQAYDDSVAADWAATFGG